MKILGLVAAVAALALAATPGAMAYTHHYHHMMMHHHMMHHMMMRHHMMMHHGMMMHH